MNNLIQNLSIKNKLIMIIMTSVLLSIILIGTVVIVNEQQVLKRSMNERMQTLARIISDRSTAAISFDDQQSATEILSALAQEPSIVLACTYDSQQSLFAAYYSIDSVTCPSSLQKSGFKFTEGYFELSHPIISEDENIGSLFIQTTLMGLQEQLIDFITLMMILVLVVGIFAYFLAVKLQTIISKPILELTNVAKNVSEADDFKTQLPLVTKDEIGTLIKAFDNMFKQIHKRQVARDRAEELLTEREQDLKITLNSIGDAVIATDIEGNITRMNPVAEKLTGWPLKDALNRSLKTVFSIINASTKEPIPNPVERVIEFGDTVNLSNHTTLISRDGTEYQIADSAAPIRNDDGKIQGMVLVFNDVTDQYRLRQEAVKSENKYQTLAKAVPVGIYYTNEQGNPLYVNEKWSEMTGLSLEQAQNDGWIKSLFPGDREAVSRAWNSLVNDDKPFKFEYRFQQEHGIYWVLGQALAEKSEGGEITGYIGSITDITDRKLQEEQLRRSQKMDALGKLTGGIAHDYNNMLGVILGYSDLLKDMLKDQPKLKKYASEIHHAGQRGAELTKKLLSFTRTESSNAAVIDINKILQEERNVLEKTLTVRIKLVLDLAEDLWPVYLDSGDLEDAILNMSINTMHAIDGSGQLTIQTRNESVTDMDAKILQFDAGDYVTIHIIDTGCGMDAKTKEKVFEPFYTTKGEKGTGLGLSQVYGFIERSSGKVKVYSELGKGSQFTFYFPRYDKSKFEKSISVKSNDIDLTGEGTILVVDDEAALTNLASVILTKNGYRVITANSGKEALEILEKETIDLMLSDVIMPAMDGYQLASIVQSDYPSVKIQLASGYSDDRHINFVNDTLHDKILNKPFKTSDLLLRLHELLG